MEGITGDPVDTSPQRGAVDHRSEMMIFGNNRPGSSVTTERLLAMGTAGEFRVCHLALNEMSVSVDVGPPLGRGVGVH